ncbi:MAG: PDZ domain-containing protein [Phycisphaerales bacterium]|jgi:hypothetical protein
MPGVRVSLAAMVLAATAGWSMAAQSIDRDAQLAREAVERLTSDAWTERIDASATLLELARSIDGERSLAVLEDALQAWLATTKDDADSTGDVAEVFARFEFAASEAFYNSPRAGLGITYDQSPAEIGVRLGGTVPGFDAHEKLRSGDIVLSLSGIPIEGGTPDLPVAIASHQPGEQAEIELIRDGERTSVMVTLGRREDLNSARRLDEPVLRRAWAMRMDRLRGLSDRQRLNTEAPRLVLEAPQPNSPSRVRPRLADISLGGEPAMNAARRAGVVAQVLPGTDPQSAVRAELSRVNADLARVVRRAIDLEESIRQMELELRMVPDTVEGRAYAQRLRDRVSQLRRDLAPIQQEQTRLMQERVKLIQALSQ